MRRWLRRLFCRHKWVTRRTPLVLMETGEYCGVIVERECSNCGARRVRAAV